MKKVVIIAMVLLLVGMVFWAFYTAPEDKKKTVAENGSGTTSEKIEKTFADIQLRVNKSLKKALGHIDGNHKLLSIGVPSVYPLDLPENGQEWTDWLDLYGYDFMITGLDDGVEFVLMNHTGKETKYIVKGGVILTVDNGFKLVEFKGRKTFGLSVLIKFRRGSGVVDRVDVTRTYAGNEIPLEFNPEELFVTQ